MSLRSAQAVNSVGLKQAEALDYLQGKSMPISELLSGWVLMTIDDFPLGWGKSSQGIVKNYYPRGLRWQG